MEKSTKKPSPFDVISWIFTDDKAFSEASDAFLAENAFIINRTFSIKWPQQAQAFNIAHINQAEMIRAWKMFLLRAEQHGKVPYWCFTKGSKRAFADKDAKADISKADIKQYAAYACISLEDSSDFAELFPREFNECVKHMKCIANAKDISNQIKKTKNNEDSAV